MANRDQRRAKKARAGAATKRKEPMNRPPVDNKTIAEYQGIAAFPLTSRTIPMELMRGIAENLSALNAVYLYCRADTYSRALRPLEFGAALSLLPVRHSGQVLMVRLYNDDAAIPVETEELGILTEQGQLEEAWANTFDMVWEAEPETETELEVIESDSATQPTTEQPT